MIGNLRYIIISLNSYRVIVFDEKRGLYPLLVLVITRCATIQYMVFAKFFKPGVCNLNNDIHFYADWESYGSENQGSNKAAKEQCPLYKHSSQVQKSHQDAEQVRQGEARTERDQGTGNRGRVGASALLSALRKTSR